jgi:hypothetical protein
LRLNIDFSDAGYLAGTSGLNSGDLTLCNASPVPSGSTVRDFLNIVNNALGGGMTPYTFGELSSLTQEVNAAFSRGLPSQFAQDLVNGTCS